MDKYKAEKPPPCENLESIAKHLSEQPEKLNLEFWKEYFYWVWRIALFIISLNLLTNYSQIRKEGLIGAYDHIAPVTWALIVLLALLGPAIFVGWSLLWARGQDFWEQIRRR